MRGREEGTRLRQIALALTLVLLNGVAYAAGLALDEPKTKAGRGAAPVVAMKWQPPCQVEQSESYFSVDVFEDGSLRYIGGRQAKETGERRGQITSAQFQRLFSRHMIRTLHDVVYAEKWVCPARPVADSESNVLYTRPFCQDAMNPVIARFTVADEGTCSSYHSIVVYADGLAYYAALQGSSSRPGYKTAFDAYFQLGPDALKRLMDDIKRSRLAHGEMLAESPTKGPLDIVSPDFDGFDPADMKRLRDGFAAELGLHWFAFTGDWLGCRYDGPRSQVWLKAEQNR